MNWNDYEAIWKRQQLPVGANADLSRLRETFEAKHRKMRATLYLRDILEFSAGVIVVLAMSLAWWQQGKIGWPIALAIIPILGVMGRFVGERLRAQRDRLRPDAPLLVKIESDVAELRRQRSLLLGMWKWYLGPCAASAVIFSLAISRNRPPWDIVRDPLFLGAFWSFFALILWFAWVINRRAVRKQLEPRIEELEKLRQDLLFST